MTAIGDPLCSAEDAHEYLGRKAEAIVTSVQNGDNSPSTTTGLNYLGTVPPAVAPCPLRAESGVFAEQLVEFCNHGSVVGNNARFELA